MRRRSRDAVAEPAVRCRGGRYYVSITEGLSRRDLQRLERACGRALQLHTPPLEIHISAGARLDAAAVFFLECLRARGVAVIGLPDSCDSSEEP